jgi:outer membrane protein TolC
MKGPGILRTSHRLVISSAFLWPVLVGFAQTSPASVQVSTNSTCRIDLPAALRLAGAQNLDVEIARARVAEATANWESSMWQFFPWVSVGASYRRHEGLIQNVEGRILDVDKESYTAGPSVTGQLDLGDAIYKNLAARELAKASGYALESQRDDALLAAAQGYFDLLKARNAVEVARQAVRISTNYASQIEQANSAGIAFKGDMLRVQVQTERNLVTLRQTREQQRIASVRLAQTLRLNQTIELLPADDRPITIELLRPDVSLESLVSRALASRSEAKQIGALVRAARDAKNGATYGPMIPSLSAQVFAGGLGGSGEGTASRFGQSQDYAISLGWRIGPGGLFDRGRLRASEARLRIAEVGGEKLRDEITRQVIESYARLQSLADQLVHTRRAIGQAEETLQLTLQRKEFGVGAVLEAIQAEQELTRARLDYVNTTAEYNKVQYGVQRSTGGLTTTTANEQREQGGQGKRDEAN